MSDTDYVHERKRRRQERRRKAIEQPRVPRIKASGGRMRKTRPVELSERELELVKRWAAGR